MKRQRRLLALLLTLVMLLGTVTVPASALDLPSYEGPAAMASLTEAASSGVYAIATETDLRALADYVNAGKNTQGVTFCLTADIALGDTPWVPIGQYRPGGEDSGYPFQGTFDGQGHSITGLTVTGASYTSGSGDYNEANGLFGVNDGVIENVAVNADISTYRCGGAIAGHNLGTIRYCETSGKITANGGGSTRGTGGIAGENRGTVESCYSSCTVYNGYRRAGGLVGYNLGTVKHSYFAGSVSSASRSYSGGVACTNSAAGVIENCYYLKDSCADGVAYWQMGEGDKEVSGSETGVTFDASDYVLSSDGTTRLRDALNTDNEGAYIYGSQSSYLPVLYWQEGYSGSRCTVSITQPRAGAEGSVTLTVGGRDYTSGSVVVDAGTSVTVTAPAPSDGYYYLGIQVDGKRQASDGVTGGGSYTFTAAGDTAVTAVYVSTADTALTLSAQTGADGGKTVLHAFTWAELDTLAAANTDPLAYIAVARGANRVYSPKDYVKLSDLLGSDYVGAYAPNAADRLVVVSSDGEWEAGYLTYGASQSLKTYASIEDFTAKQNAAVVPTVIALSSRYASPADDTATAFTAAAESARAGAVKTGSFTLLAGLLDDSSNSAAQRIRGSVVSLVLRRDAAAYGSTGEIVAAPLDESAYTAYGVSYDPETSTATVTATALLESEAGGSKGHWAGIAIPVPDGTDYADICLGSSASALKNAGLTERDKVTIGGKDYVPFYWEADKTELTSVQVSFDGGATVSEILVDASGVSCDYTVSLFGTEYSLSEIKGALQRNGSYANATTAVFKKGSNEVEVTGITVKKLLEVLELDADAYATIRFAAGDGFASAADQYAYSWDDVMLIWDGDGASDGNLKSAVNGAAGRLWNKGVVSVTGDETAFRFGETLLSLSQLKAKPTSATFAKGDGETAVTGIRISDLIETYAPDAAPDRIWFYAQNADGSRDYCINKRAGGAPLMVDNATYPWDSKAMIVWEENGSEIPLRAAADGAAGNLWWSGVVGCDLYSDFTITATPASAAVTVTDSDGAEVTANEDGTYPVVLGQTYTYKVTASGYTAKSDEFVPALDSLSLTVALSARGGGGTPAEPTLFSVYLQKGENGTRTLKKAFTASEIKGLLDKNAYAYLYSHGDDGWNAVVSTELITLEDLMLESGITSEWKSGSYLKFTCKDGEYGKDYPSYNDIAKGIYSYTYQDGDFVQNVVPAGISISWNSGFVADTGEDLTAENYAKVQSGAYNSGSYRLVYGITAEQFENHNPAGARMPSQVIDITVVYEGTRPTGSVGNTHTDEPTEPVAEEPAEIEVNVTATVSDGAATAKVTDAAVNSALNQVESGDTLALVPTGTGSADKVTVEVSAQSAEKIAQAAALAVKTGAADVKLPAGTLSALAEAAEQTVSVTTEAMEDGSVAVEVAVDGEALEEFPGIVSVTVPAGEDQKDGLVLALVDEDGNETIVKKSYAEDDRVHAVLDGSCTVKLIDNAKEFEDVKAGEWYEAAVDWATSHEVCNGVSSTKFAPNDTVSRAMLATMLYRLEDAQASGGSEFADVPDGQWYSEAVAWASEAGVVNGTGKGFEPDASITREQLATMLYRYAGTLGAEGKTGDLSAFSDSDSVSGYAQEAMAWAVGSGIINGRGSALEPGGTATRAESATMLLRLVKLLTK